MARSDLVVVGGGVIGLSCAWRCRQAGAEVSVVDPGLDAGGAWHAAAGMLAPVTEAHFGEEVLVELNLRSAGLWPGLAEELEDASGMEIGYRREGTIAVAFDSGDRAVLQQLHGFQRELGLESSWLGPSACREIEPLVAPGVAGGLLVPGDHQVDPRRLVAALAAACRVAGVRLVAGEVAEVLAGEVVSGVRLADGETILAGATLVAAGWRSAQLPGLPEAARPPVRPVKGQILRLRVPPGTPRPEHNLRAVVQASSVYVVPRGDGEIVVGASVEEMGADTRVTAGPVYNLLRDAQLLVPGLFEAELVECVAGLRPGSPDNFPIMGRGVLPGLLVATGHYRNGIHLAPVTADLVAGLLAGGDAPGWALPFDPLRFVAAPEAARHS